MSFEILISLALITLAGSFTPGPNNALLAASGANFGLRRTLPHVAGITVGFPVMALVVGILLGELFQHNALFRELVRWIGAALLLWVAWQIARHGGLARAGERARPFSMVESAAFQWINPKAWVMAIAITAQFIDPMSPWTSALMVAMVLAATALCSAIVWAGAGQLLARWLSDPLRLRLFNLSMAALITAGVAAMVIQGI